MIATVASLAAFGVLFLVGQVPVRLIDARGSRMLRAIPIERGE